MKLMFAEWCYWTFKRPFVKLPLSIARSLPNWLKYWVVIDSASRVTADHKIASSITAWEMLDALDEEAHIGDRT